MFSSWNAKNAAFLRLNAEIEARKGWAALREHYRRHPPKYGNHYDPNQPRVPAGNPDGGEWTSVDRVQDHIKVAGRILRIPPPRVPPQKPTNREDRIEAIKEVAKWLLAVGGALGHVLKIAPCLREYRAQIESYRNPPKTLEELQRAASQPRIPGYQDHHIVEQTPARDRNDPEWKINAPENMVRIPTLKHREI